MGLKARKKAGAKNVKKAAAQYSASKEEASATDYLPLEGGPARGIPETENRENKATVLYICRIPHGFYEAEMEAFFKQFGAVTRLRIARNRKLLTSSALVSQSLIYSLDELGNQIILDSLKFMSPEVAKIVEACMHNYLMYEHLLQVSIVPPEKVHPKLWKGVSRTYKPLDWVQVERKHHDKKLIPTIDGPFRFVDADMNTAMIRSFDLPPTPDKTLKTEKKCDVE